MCFISDDGTQNIFVSQPTLDMLELKNTRALIMFKGGIYYQT